MAEINRITGRDYKPFNYYGASDAERVIITMGSSAGCIRKVVDYLTAKGEKVGFVDVHLYRPLSVGHEVNTVPEGTISCKFWGLGSDISRKSRGLCCMS